MKHIIFCLLILIIFLSCERKEQNNPYLDIKISEERPDVSYKQLKYTMKLPDTLIVDKSYNATVEFESDFDQMIDPLQAGGSTLKDSTKSRLIYFYQFEPVKSPMEQRGNLILRDSTFILNKSFVINNITFKEKGEFVFCGLIKDEIMYNYYNKKGIRDSVHFDRRKQQIFKKVVVIDK